MSWIAVGVGTATAIGGAVQSSNAAHSATFAQKSAANQYQDSVSANQANSDAMIMNPAAIAANDQALSAQESQVQRQEQLAQSVNPALVEQGKQYMQLLQGKSAPVLSNLQQQRSLQRQQLVSQLQTQMGPGAETSTAGQQALAQFDQQTSNILSQAQEQYTGMLGQMTMAAPGAENAFGTANTQLSDISNNSPQAQAARLNLGFAGPEGQASIQQINTAGASSAGQAVTGAQMTSLGATVAGGAFGKYNRPGGNPGTPSTLGNDFGAGSGNMYGNSGMSQAQIDAANSNYGLGGS